MIEPTDMPPEPPAIRRQTARVLPVDTEGRVLLLHGWDPHHPDHPFWFTIGGAVEEGDGEVGGESLRDAAARELYEETRISVDPAQLGEPIAQNTIEFSWGGHRILQDQTFYAVLVDLGRGEPRWPGPVGAGHHRQIRLARGRRPGRRRSARASRHPRLDPRRGGQRPPPIATGLAQPAGIGSVVPQVS